MFTFAESGAISHTNTKKRWIQQVAGIPRIPLKLLWSESADLKFIASTEEKRGQQESAEQRPSFSTTKTTPSARKGGTGS